jgi:putative addiction module component (TIGR02574 family)
MSTAAVQQLMALSVEERLLAIGALWDSIVDEAPDYPISDGDRRVIEQRLEEHRRDPEAGIPWDVVRAQLATIE